MQLLLGQFTELRHQLCLQGSARDDVMKTLISQGQCRFAQVRRRSAGGDQQAAVTAGAVSLVLVAASARDLQIDVERRGVECMYAIVARRGRRQSRCPVQREGEQSPRLRAELPPTIAELADQRGGAA